mgnify:CR=1 FL=1
MFKEVFRLIPDDKLHIYFCDVGQGDGIYVRTPDGLDILVDGGPDQKILSCLSEKMPLLDRKIEIIFLTHKQNDHLTGILAVLQKYEVGELIDSADYSENNLTRIWYQYLKKYRVRIKTAQSGMNITSSDGVSFSLLWPEDNYFSSDPNEFSTSFTLKYGNFYGLFTGDLSYDAQDLLLTKNQEGLQNLTLLKIPHHGSQKDLHTQFINHVSPRLAVISVGKNSYGHPGKKVLEFLESLHIKTFRTDQNGTIGIETDGKTFSVITEKP